LDQLPPPIARKLKFHFPTFHEELHFRLIEMLGKYLISQRHETLLAGRKKMKKRKRYEMERGGWKREGNVSYVLLPACNVFLSL